MCSVQRLIRKVIFHWFIKIIWNRRDYCHQDYFKIFILIYAVVTKLGHPNGISNNLKIYILYITIHFWFGMNTILVMNEFIFKLVIKEFWYRVMHYYFWPGISVHPCSLFKVFDPRLFFIILLNCFKPPHYGINHVNVY